VSGETIRLSMNLSLAVDFLHAAYTKEKEMLVFNFIFNILPTSSGSSVNSAPFFGFRELK